VKRSKWLLRRTDQLVDLLHISDMKTKIFQVKIADKDQNFFLVNPRGVALSDNWLVGRKAFEQRGGVIQLDADYDINTQYLEITIWAWHSNPSELTMFLLGQNL
jgi:hypothetical protein